MDTKSVSRSVSLNEGLWALIDTHSEGHGGRSEFFRRLAMGELERVGKLPGAPSNVVATQALSTAQMVGPERVLKTLKRLRGRVAKEKVVPC